MIRVQEAIFQVKPTVIVETGIAHGGSLIYSASLLKTMDIEGRVIGVTSKFARITGKPSKNISCFRISP